MSTFVCENCGVIENTALSRFWMRGRGPALCSECDPQLGKWHGAFPRTQYDPDAQQVQWVDGKWLSPPEEAA